MKKILLFGSTGLIGDALLRQLLARPELQVIAFSRKPIELPHAEAAFINHVINFDNLEDHARYMVWDVLFCCLGTTMRKAKTQAAFRKTDYELVLRIAKIATDNHVKKLLVISSVGANAASNNFYLKTKGEMEDDLQALPIDQLTILRPSILTGKRKEFRLSERAGIALASLISPLMAGGLSKYKPIAATTVAKAMIRLSEQITDRVIYESSDLQQIAQQ